MQQTIHAANKALLVPLREALYNYDANQLQQVLEQLFHPQAQVQLACPLEDLDGPGGLYRDGYAPLQQAIPDLERRDYIVMAGSAGDGSHWVGCAGYYTGTFARPWLEILPTGHMVGMRFHEFFRIEENRVVEMQALWDIPEVMMQANAWPMSPSLGREWHIPGPASQDGILVGPYDQIRSDANLKLVGDMCDALGNHKDGGPEAMRLPDYWHPHCSWYGPAGIGSCRGIAGFRNWHQIPFLNAMPNRVGDASKGYLFADGDFVGFTAWPGMHMSITGDGWLGIAPAGQQITMRSLDFWRCENGLIRENWVLVDLLDVYRQIGVDVFARLKEFNKARLYYTSSAESSQP